MIQMTDEQRELFELGKTSANIRQPKVVHGTQLTGNIEWYTPPEYVEAARKVMGKIDCDPASSVLAQNVIQANTYYTIHDNGLSKSWTGSVWLNPPYAAKLINPFVDKLLAHLEDGAVSHAIMLTHCNTDTKWYHRAVESQHCSSICQTRGRVRFYDANGTANSPTHGHIFIYFGKRKARFRNEFKKFGKVWCQ